MYLFIMIYVCLKLATTSYPCLQLYLITKWVIIAFLACPEPPTSVKKSRWEPPRWWEPPYLTVQFIYMCVVSEIVHVFHQGKQFYQLE